MSETIELPCTVVIGPCEFELEAVVSYTRTSEGITVSQATVNGVDLELDEDALEQLAGEVDQLFPTVH